MLDTEYSWAHNPQTGRAMLYFEGKAIGHVFTAITGIWECTAMWCDWPDGGLYGSEEQARAVLLEGHLLWRQQQVINVLKWSLGRWVMDGLSPSGKQLFRCLVCRSVSYAPDRECLPLRAPGQGCRETWEMREAGGVGG